MKYVTGKVIISHTKAILVIIYVVIVICYVNISNVSAVSKAPALLVFGDSLVDPGNNNFIKTIATANFPPYGRDFDNGKATGRFCNGKIPSDLIAEEMGIKELLPPYLDPTLTIDDLLTGVSFASSACGYDPDSSKLANVLTLDAQLKKFKEYISKLKGAEGDNVTSTIISQSVYIVCAGSNDITNTYYGLPFTRLRYNNNVSSYTTSMVNWASTFVQELYDLGARKIGVINVLPNGCMPSQRTVYGGLSRNCVDKENQASIGFNKKLNSKLNSLNQNLIGSTIVYLDMYNPLIQLINNPFQSGFTVVDKGCCGTGEFEVSFLCNRLSISTCKDASKYVFWDSFHPTEAAYRIIVHDMVQKNPILFA